MHACFIVLQLRSDSCQIHGYVMLCHYLKVYDNDATIYYIYSCNNYEV